MLVDQIADVVHVSFGEDPAVVDQQDVRRHRLDLVQDVARHDDALAGAGPLADQADRLAARDRVHPPQRLVEDQQLRVVDDRLRELHALAHPFAVGADLLVRGVEEIDDSERAPRGLGRLGVAEAVEPDERADPLQPGHAVVERVLLGAESDLEKEMRVAPDRLAEDGDAAFARAKLTGDQLHERRLAGAVRAEQTGHAGRHADRHVVEADDLPVPLRDVVRRDDGRAHVTTSTPRTRRSSTEIDTTTSPTMTSSETDHGVS